MKPSPLAPLLAFFLAACATAPPRPLAPPPPLSTLLGQPRHIIENYWAPQNTLNDGSITYTDTLSILYEEGQAVELREKIPPDLGCKEAAIWMGFTTARPPLLQKTRCLWPYDSPRHSLGPGVLGTMGFKDRLFVVRLPQRSP